MRAFALKSEVAATTRHAAFDTHCELAAIHPFSDGNGRTAWLLMDLQLIRAGHPLIVPKPTLRHMTGKDLRYSD